MRSPGAVLDVSALLAYLQRERGHAEADLDAVGVRVYAFDADDAACAAELWASTRNLGLSLGDRACLALAKRLHAPAYTADRAWAQVKVPGVTVTTVR